ncbi:hypothetical protein KY332_02935 [Candidatus Woesearchaeota archaeon]|nr:hypothetical protein [Candidatus Woesearchaeota archaeon]
MFGFGKGKIEIKLNKYEFAPGEVIEGTLVLTLKKPMEAGGLTIGLVGYQKTVQGFGTHRRYRTIKVFDFEKPIDGAKGYSTQPMEYKFTLKIPANVATGKMPEGALGGVVKAAQLLTQTRSRVDWRVVGRLKVKGIDVSKKVKVNVA